MLSVALAVLLTAAPSPRVAASASQYIFVPRLDRLENVRGFVSLAGRKTSMMRSAIWSEEALPFLSIDLMSPESLAAAGIDPQGSLTLSLTPGGSVSCVTLSKPDEFTTRAKRALDRGGPKWTGQLPNTNFYAVVGNEGAVMAGFVQRGNNGCVIKSHKGRGGALMFEAEKLLGVVKAPASFKNMTGLSGPILLGSPDAVAAVRGTDNSLIVDARGVKLPISTPTLAPAGSSPYANIPNSGVLTVKAKVDPAAIAPYARSFANQLMSFCTGCNSKDLSDAIVALSGELTGNLYLRVDTMSLDPRALRTDAGRYFALRHAYFAEMKNGPAVKELLKQLPPIKGLVKTEKGFQVQSPDGTIDLMIVGNHFIIANDLDALGNAMKLVTAAQPGKLTHSVEGQGDVKPLGKALRKVTFMDAMTNTQMAGLFAAGIEFGPLLSSTEKTTFWADPGMPMKAQAVWVLEREGAKTTGSSTATSTASSTAMDAGTPQATADGGSDSTSP